MATTTAPAIANPATCHPDRAVKARGLCKPCWSKEQRAGWASASTALAIADIGPGTTVRFGRQSLVHEASGTAAGLAKLYDGAVVDVSDVRLYAAPGPVTCPECVAEKAATPSKAEMKRRSKLAADALATLPKDAAGIPTLGDISGAQYPGDPDTTAGSAAAAGKTACPDCTKEVSTANLARHRKTHAA